jgi:hypothetical protein
MLKKNTTFVSAERINVRIVILEPDHALGVFLKNGLKLKEHTVVLVEDGQAALDEVALHSKRHLSTFPFTKDPSTKRPLEAVSESCAFDEGRMYGHSVWQGSHTLPTRAEHKVTNWIY